ncbi:MAG: hypothetical protein LKF42_08780 [Streptococcaceae bacterium]|jgi:hypothetical protein|nr:hypothetical protein [Streptococcaceae bacterium]MCH4177282.1 hypothetical protein [Streptococcaceae bacterium]
MDKFGQARYDMLKPAIIDYLKQFKSSPEHQSFRSKHSKYEADTILILQTYNELQKAFNYNEINKIVETKDFKKVSQKLYELCDELHSLEYEIYKSTREIEHPEVELDDLYARMISNNKMDLFEMIELALDEIDNAVN